MFKHNLFNTAQLILLIAFSVATSQAMADRKQGDIDLTFNFSYVESEDFDFAGGATASVESTSGYGLGLSYNYTSRLALRADMAISDSSFIALRILDQPGNPSQATFGDLDMLNLSIGADYYFTDNRISPFISGGLGWSYASSNIPSGPPSAACFWDPWYGYICTNTTSTYDETTFFYNFGAGVRIEIGDRNFIKLGYYNNRLDFDHASSSNNLGSFRFDIGFSIK